MIRVLTSEHLHFFKNTYTSLKMNILCILCKVHFPILTGYIATLIHLALLMVYFALLRVQFVFSGLILFFPLPQGWDMIFTAGTFSGNQSAEFQLSRLLSGRVGQLWTDVTVRKWWLRTAAKREPYSFTVRFAEGSGAAL